MRSARIRAIASDGPPAENGTMMVMGRDGKFCAATGPTDISNAANANQNDLRKIYLPETFLLSRREPTPRFYSRILDLMVRSAASPRLSNHEATGLATIFLEASLRDALWG